jgi:hypothetical protein
LKHHGEEVGDLHTHRRDVELRADRIQTVEPGEIVEKKRLGAALATVKQHQDTYEPHPPGQPTKGRPSRQIAATLAAERVAAGLNPHKPSPPVSPA